MALINCDHIPHQWIDEYLKASPSLSSFLRQKAREVQEEPALCMVKPIIKVIRWLERDASKPIVYYVDKTRMLSIYALLGDTNPSDLIAVASERLRPRLGAVIKVLVKGSIDGAYFVAEDELVVCCQSDLLSLLIAMGEANHTVALYLLQTIEGILTGCTEQERDRLLFQAIHADNVELFQHIYNMPSWAHLKLRHPTALQHIATYNSPNILQYLIDTAFENVIAMANLITPNPITPDIDLPLHTAAWWGHDDIAVTILKYTEKRAILRCRGSLLLAAVHGRASNLLAALITDELFFRNIAENGYIFNLKILHHAALILKYRPFKLLYDAYVRANLALERNTRDGSTAFHALISTCDVSKIRQFIDDAGSDELIVMADTHNQTPLHWAAVRGLWKIVDMLYSIFAVRGLLLEKTKGHGDTFFTYLIHTKHTSIIRLLIQRPDFDTRLVSETDNYGCTPMMRAIEGLNTEICELLYALSLTTGALLLTSLDRGCNALMCAAASSFESAVYLFTLDPDLCSSQMVGDNNGLTPLHHAVLTGSIVVCARIYKRAGLRQIRAQTKHYQLTALHLAVLYRSVPIIKILLHDRIKAKGLINITDSEGHTALDYALMRSPVMAAVLLAVSER